MERDELNQPDEAELRRLPAMSAIQPAAELAAILPSGNETLQELARRAMMWQLSSTASPSACSGQLMVAAAHLLVVDDADDADLDDIPSASVCSVSAGVARSRLAVAQHDEDDLVAGPARHQTLDVGVLHRDVDGDEAVSRHEACDRGRAVGADFRDGRPDTKRP